MQIFYFKEKNIFQPTVLKCSCDMKHIYLWVKTTPNSHKNAILYAIKINLLKVIVPYCEITSRYDKCSQKMYYNTFVVNHCSSSN